MNKKNQLFRHTHFVGIPVSGELEEIVEESRSYMAAVYGCKSGQGTPPHITLVAPFALMEDASERELLDALCRAGRLCSGDKIFPFEVQVCGFGSFSERTLFANVKDSDEWQKVHKVFSAEISRAFPSAIKKSERRFFPHLSIANRDIPSGVMDEALKHFSLLDIKESFLADAVALYKRRADGRWFEWQRIECEKGASKNFSFLS